MKKDEKLIRLKEIAEETSILRKSMVEELGPQILELAAVISGVIGAGGKLLLAGNGGSAGHSADGGGEMVVRRAGERNGQARPAIALSADTAVLTAAANDFGVENVFARQVEGIGQKGDMLFVLSTSGNSPNLIKAVDTAKRMGIITVGLLGNSGGKLASAVDRALVIPHPSTQRVQEEHIFIIHLLVELVEGDLIK